MSSLIAQPSNHLRRILAASTTTKKPDACGRVHSWWRLPDSNWGHAALQAAALPTELKRRYLWDKPTVFLRSRRANGIHLLGLLFSLKQRNDRGYFTDITGVFQCARVCGGDLCIKSYTP